MVNLNIIIAILSIIILAAPITESLEFSYSNQEKWEKKFPKCGLKRQSPIELWNPRYTIKKSMPSLRFKNYNKLLPTPLLYENNGHTINVIPQKSRHLPIISGKHLNGKFILEQFHFHWGTTNDVGSEHTIRGKRYALELHMVHRNVKYKTLKEASKYIDGIVVLGILYKANNIFKSFNFGLGHLLYNLEVMRKFSSDVQTYSSFRLQELFQHINLDKYFLYKGSLTTPPCSQSVTWIIMGEIEETSVFQMSFFRNLRDQRGNILSNNYRYLQNIGKRRVYLNV